MAVLSGSEGHLFPQMSEMQMSVRSCVTTVYTLFLHWTLCDFAMIRVFGRH